MAYLRCVVAVLAVFLVAGAASTSAKRHIAVDAPRNGNPLRLTRVHTELSMSNHLDEVIQIAVVAPPSITHVFEWTQFSLTSADACVAIYTDTRATSMPAACLGDLLHCAKSRSPEARKCYSTLPGHTAAHLFLATLAPVYMFYDGRGSGVCDLSIVPSPAVTQSSLYRLTRAQHIPGAPQPDRFEIAGTATGDAPDAPFSVYIGPHIAGRFEAGANFQVKGWADHVDAWGKLYLEFDKTVEGARVIQEIAVHEAVEPLNVRVAVAVRPPNAQVLVGIPEIYPALPWQGWLVAYSLCDGEEVVDTALYNPTAATAPRPLTLQRCDVAHSVEVSIISVGGDLLHTQAVAVDPAMYCVARGLSPDCVCGGRGSTRRRSAELPPLVQYNELVVDFAGSDIEGLCGRARHLATSATIEGQALDGQCVFRDPVPGQYFVEAPLGELVAYITVCRSDGPTIQAEVDNAGDGLAYLYINDGTRCSSTTTIPARPLFEWFYATTPDEPGEGLAISTSAVLWYPKPGYYWAMVMRTVNGVETEDLTPRYEVTDTHSAANTPRGCVGYTATLNYTHIPMFATDHQAIATVTAGPAPADDAEWWVIIDAGIGECDAPSVIEERDDAGRAVYAFHLEAGASYRVRVMRVPLLPDGDKLYAGEACYLEAGRIQAHVLPEIHVESPIEIVDCGPEQSVIVFSVKSNVRLDGPPTAGHPVEELEAEELDMEEVDGMYAYKYVMTEFVAGASVKPLALLFHLGDGHTYLSETLQHIVAEHLYPPPTMFGGGVELFVPDRDGHSEYHFASKSHLVSIGYRKTTTLSTATMYSHDLPYSSDDDYDLDFEVKYSRGEFVVTINTVSLPAGSPDQGIREYDIRLVGAPILEAFCPPVHIVAEVPQYIDVAITIEVVAVSETPSEILCAGQRLLKFHPPAGTPDWIEFRALGDADIGWAVLGGGKAHAVTMGRDTDIRYCAHIASGGETLYEGTLTLPVDAWLPPVPAVAVGSFAEPKCARHGEPAARAELALDVTGADSLELEGMTTTGTRVTPQADGSISLRDGTRYVFENLALGHYVSTAARTTEGITCRTVTHHFLGNDPHLYTVEDAAHKRSASDTMACPVGMYGGAQVWQAYLDVAYSDYFAAHWVQRQIEGDPDITVDAVVHRLGATPDTPAAANAPRLFNKLGKYVSSYKLPAPDAYVPRVSVDDGSVTCAFYLPQYAVTQPMFSADMFYLAVVSFPTCAASTNGVVVVNYPSDAQDVFARVVSCTPWQAEVSPTDCVHGAQTVSSAGVVTIENVPFATSLGVEFEVAGACRFTKTFEFLPTRGAFPVVSRLRYIPSCGETHAVEALYIDPITHVEARIPVTSGREFVWSGACEQENRGNVYECPYADFQDATVALEVRTSECASTAQLTIDASEVLAPPRVDIEPPIPGHGYHSLPLFCPEGADAVLYATLFPPLRPGGDTVSWDAAAATATSKILNNERVMAHDLPAGEYTINYTRTLPHGSFSCSDVATMVIPEKPSYIAKSHIRVKPAACSGGTASAHLLSAQEHGDCGVKPEFDVFTATMVPSAQRKYIKDSGYGSSDITDVPEGTDMRIRVPYPEAYIYHSGDFCPEALHIKFPRTAPIPVFVNTPVVDCEAERAALSAHVSPWHTTATVVWNTGVVDAGTAHGSVTLLSTEEPMYELTVTDVARGCTQHGSAPFASKLTDAGDVVAYSAEPALQTLCPSELPAPVRIYRENKITGMRTLVETLTAADIVALPSVETPAAIPTRTYAYWPVDAYHYAGCVSARVDIEFAISEIPASAFSNMRWTEHVNTAAPRWHFAGEIGPVDLPGNPEGGVAVVSGEASHTVPDILPISYTRLGVTCIAYYNTAPLVAELIDPEEAMAPVMVVQGRGLPVPAMGYQSMTIGVRDVDTAPVPVDIYIQHATTLSHIALSRGAGRGSDVVIATIPIERSNRSPHWSHFARAELPPGYRYTFTLVLPDDDARRRTQQSTPVATVSAQVNVGYPIAVTCTVDAHASTPYSHDGEIEVNIQGGMGPFVLIWQDLPAATTGTGRVHRRTGVRAGHYILGVHQSNQPISAHNRASCSVAVTARSRFEIESATQIAAAGCGPTTTGTVRLLVAGGASVASVGWWAPKDMEPAIEACADSRMVDDFRVAPDGVSPELALAHGSWMFAVCDATGALVNTAGWEPLVIPQLHTGLAVSVAAHGEICMTDEGARVVKVAPALAITGAVNPAAVRVVRAMGGSSAVDVAALGVGMHELEVSEPLTGCAVPVVIHVADTGAGPCGTCVADDSSCYGCDGVANSGALVDRCGRCGGQSLCLTDCYVSWPSIDTQVIDDVALEIATCADHRAAVRLVGDLDMRNMLRADRVAGRHLLVEGGGHAVDFGALPLVALYVELRDVVIPAGTTVRVAAREVYINNSIIAGSVVVQPSGCDTPLEPAIPRFVVSNSRLVGRPTLQVMREPGACYSTPRARRAGEEEGGGGGGASLEECEVEDGVTLIGPEGRILVEVNGSTTITYGFGNGTIEVDPDSGITCIDVTDVNYDGFRPHLACQLFVDVPSLKKVIDGDKEWTRGVLRDNNFCDGALDKNTSGSANGLAIALPLAFIGMFIFALFAWGISNSWGAPRQYMGLQT